MAEDKPEQNLGTLLGTKKLTIKDKNGKEHVLHPLDMEDIADLEEILGPLGEWLMDGIHVKNFVRILWASMRKDGVTENDIINRNWKIKPVEVGRMFDAGHVNLISESVLAILEVSGFRVTKGVRRPLQESAPAATAGVPSSGAPSVSE